MRRISPLSRAILVESSVKYSAVHRKSDLQPNDVGSFLVKPGSSLAKQTGQPGGWIPNLRHTRLTVD
jgi:hypothetical protein